MAKGKTKRQRRAASTTHAIWTNWGPLALGAAAAGAVVALPVEVGVAIGATALGGAVWLGTKAKVAIDEVVEGHGEHKVLKGRKRTK